MVHGCRSIEPPLAAMQDSSTCSTPACLPMQPTSYPTYTPLLLPASQPTHLPTTRATYFIFSHKMKQQSAKWVAMGLLVLMSLSMAAAGCDEEERNLGQGGRGQDPCRASRLDDCRDFIRRGQGQGQQGQDQPPRRCCQELQQMPSNCRCDAVQQIFEEEAQQYGMDMEFNQRGRGQQQQQRQMMERARQLPSRCNVSPSRCDIRQRGIYMPGSIW